MFKQNHDILTFPILSIIVPIYNMEKYLIKAICSVKNQTFQEWELILVNDGSTDNSRCICEKFAKNESRITIINQNNKGVSSARNKGLSLAKGKYITFLDPDDWIDNNLYSKLISHMENNNCSMCIYGFTIENAGFSTKSPIYKKSVIDNYTAIYEMFKGTYWGGHLWNKVYLKELIKNIKLDNDIHFCEDLLFNYKVMSNLNNIYYFPVFGYHYLQRNNSAIRDISKKIDYEKVYVRITNFNTMPLYIKKEIDQSLYSNRFFNILDIILSNKVNSYIDYCKNIKYDFLINIFKYTKIINKKRWIYFCLFLLLPISRWHTLGNLINKGKNLLKQYAK